ncbi:hypothetical protein RFI_25792, partial [Reticulomyxa filosa]
MVQIFSLFFVKTHKLLSKKSLYCNSSRFCFAGPILDRMSSFRLSTSQSSKIIFHFYPSEMTEKQRSSLRYEGYSIVSVPSSTLKVKTRTKDSNTTEPSKEQTQKEAEGKGLKKEETKKDEVEKWDVQLYMEGLETEKFGRNFMFVDSVDSTQNVLKSNHDILPSGTLVTCNQQLQGRGRGGNSWQSPLGCLMASFVVHLNKEHGTLLPCAQHVIAIALLKGIHAVTNNQLLERVKIKWPNDIYYVAERSASKSNSDYCSDYLQLSQKIGGILCESQYDNNRKQYHITCGFGLN